MDRIFDADGLIIEYDRNNNILITRFVTKDYITEDELYNMLKELNVAVDKLKPSKVLIDTKDIFFH